MPSSGFVLSLFSFLPFLASITLFETKFIRSAILDFSNCTLTTSISTKAQRVSRKPQDRQPKTYTPKNSDFSQTRGLRPRNSDPETSDPETSDPSKYFRKDLHCKLVLNSYLTISMSARWI